MQITLHDLDNQADQEKYHCNKTCMELESCILLAKGVG